MLRIAADFFLSFFFSSAVEKSSDLDSTSPGIFSSAVSASGFSNGVVWVSGPEKAVSRSGSSRVTFMKVDPYVCFLGSPVSQNITAAAVNTTRFIAADWNKGDR